MSVDVGDGSTETIADAGDGLTARGGIAQASDGTLYAAVSSGAGLEAIDPDTGDVDSTPATTFITDGYGLGRDGKDRVLGCTDEFVVRADPETGAAKSVGEGFGYAEGVQVLPSR